MTEYRGLGFDPTPGSPDAVMAVSERCTRAVNSLPAFNQDTDGWWTGAAAGAFTGRLTGTPAELAEAQRVLAAAAEVLDEWATTLLANQRRAEQLDQRALRLRRAISEASDEVDSTATIAQFSTDPGAEQERGKAVTRYEGLRRELSEVLDEARLLGRDHLAAALRVAERLRALGTGGVEAAAMVPDRSDLFGELTMVVVGQSGFAVELAGVLLRGHGSRIEPDRGAAGAFASALADRH